MCYLGTHEKFTEPISSLELHMEQIYPDINLIGTHKRGEENVASESIIAATVFYQICYHDINSFSHCKIL